MNRCVVLLLVGLGCRQASPPAVPPPPLVAEVPSEPERVLTADQRKWEWTARNGTAEIRQRWVAEGKCSLEGEGPAGKWSLEQCLGTNVELWFASPGGDRVMEFDPSPLGVDDWEFVPVVRLYERGKPVGGTNAHALVPETRYIRPFSRRFGWLAGTAQLPGVKPHLSDDGAFVDGEAAGGYVIHFGFDGSGIPPNSTRRAPKAPPAQFALPTAPQRPKLALPGRPLVFVDPSQPAPRLTRYYCRWKGSPRANTTTCRNDSDCNGGACEGGICLKGGTHQAFTVGEVGGKQWEGCYAAEAAEISIVRAECERTAQARAGESLSCSCSMSPTDGCR